MYPKSIPYQVYSGVTAALFSRDARALLALAFVTSLVDHVKALPANVIVSQGCPGRGS